jgi:outer membrane immunogenic protein
MRRIAVIVLSVVALAGLGVSANAADIVRKAKPIVKAPPPSAPGTSGFYIGVNGGYHWGRTSFSALPLLDQTIDVRGGMAGLTFGYNPQANAVVYGLETDIDAAWMKATNWIGPVCAGCEIGLRAFGTLRGRLGYAVGKALPYFTAGLAYGSLRVSNAATAVSQTDTRAGWTIGGGIEYALDGPWSVKGEYLYYDLGDMSCGALTCGAQTEIKLKGNLLRAGFNYRF